MEICSNINYTKDYFCTTIALRGFFCVILYKDKHKKMGNEGKLPSLPRWVILAHFETLWQFRWLLHFLPV